jgi:hypothetical protein
MDRRPDRTEIEDEARSFITLGVLLQKQRNPIQKREVEKILRSSLATNAKIERIRAVDQSSDANAAQVRPNKAAGFDKTNRKQRGGNGRQSVPKSRAAKKALSRASIFHYLFREFRDIRKFGRRTLTLDAIAFPPQIKLNSNLSSFLTKIHQRSAKDLWLFLNRVESRGWLYLTKRGYNLLMLMRELCSDLVSTSFFFRKYDQRNVIDRYRRLENLFLLIHSKKEYIPNIISEMRYLIATAPDFAEDPEEIEKLVLRILSEDLTLPSLYNFLLAANMLKYRYCFSMADLIQPGLKDPISTDRFNCSSETRSRIDGHIRNLRQSLMEDRNKLQSMRRIVPYVPRTEGGEFEILGRLYERGAVGPVDFNRDKNKLMIFIPKIIAIFVESSRSVLTEKLAVDTIGQARLFKEGYFQYELELIETARRSLVDLAEKSPVFKRDRYLALRANPNDSIAIEREVLADLTDVTKALRDIMLKLIDILQVQEGKGLSMLQTDVAEIPLDSNVHIDGPILGGMTVREAIEAVIRHAYVILYYLQDQQSFALIAEEEKSARDIARKLEAVERIAEAKTYFELKEVFVRLGVIER